MSTIPDIGLSQTDGAVCGARWEADEVHHINQLDLQVYGGSGCSNPRDNDAHGNGRRELAPVRRVPSRSCVAGLRYLYIQLLDRIQRLTAHGDDATYDPEDESEADTAAAHGHVRRGHEDAGTWAKKHSSCRPILVGVYNVKLVQTR